MPFYPMNDRNNFVEQSPYYKPSLDYENIDMNTLLPVTAQNENNNLPNKSINIKY